jgi:hypothetical protein
MIPYDKRIFLSFNVDNFHWLFHLLTINKSQDQSLNMLEYTFRNQFSLMGNYMLQCQEVILRKTLKTLITGDKDGDTYETENIVYKAVFHTLR